MDSFINKKSVVISAINFSEGGPLTVLQECLSSASALLTDDWDIFALVHDKTVFNQSRVKFIEFPKSKSSWLIRLFYEWISFLRLSKKIQPDLWFSLHDITPLVRARRQAVYCHNPAPFYSMTWSEIKLSPTFWIFTLFYKYIYQLFINRNAFVIVQQDWIRAEFVKMFGKLPLVVSYPSVKTIDASLRKNEDVSELIFLYPSLPRVFKNFEVICEATKLLENRKLNGFKVCLTIDGNENRYSKWIYKKYKNVENLKFIGLQSKHDLSGHYNSSTAVIFSSKLETWGLPISEAKMYQKNLIVVDLPYAHETVGCYDKVSYFPPNDALALADIMEAIIKNNWKPTASKHDEPKQPFARDWDELWALLIKEL